MSRINVHCFKDVRVIKVRLYFQLYFPTAWRPLFKRTEYTMWVHCRFDEGIHVRDIQSNLDGSNTDGSFTMGNSNSFLSPYEILWIAQENKYLRKFSYFSVKLYVVCTH